MRIERIHNGIVLDHIKAGMGIEILKLFPLEFLKTKIDYASYVESPSLGMKDMIKVENLDVDPATLVKMGILSPSITISLIRNGQVKKKIQPKIPPIVEGVLTCENPKCITQFEKYLVSRFFVRWEDDGRVREQCAYCEHVFYS